MKLLNSETSGSTVLDLARTVKALVTAAYALAEKLAASPVTRVDGDVRSEDEKAAAALEILFGRAVVDAERYYIKNEYWAINTERFAALRKCLVPVQSKTKRLYRGTVLRTKHNVGDVITIKHEDRDYLSFTDKRQVGYQFFYQNLGMLVAGESSYLLETDPIDMRYVLMSHDMLDSLYKNRKSLATDLCKAVGCGNAKSLEQAIESFKDVLRYNDEHEVILAFQALQKIKCKVINVHHK